MQNKKSYSELEIQLSEVMSKLDEANDIIHAIRSGGIDALVVKGQDGHQLYTLKSADQTYRMFIEKMNEGAVTLNEEGLILYCNSSFAEMLEKPLPKIIGTPFISFVEPSYQKKFERALKNISAAKNRGEVVLMKSSGLPITFSFSISLLELDEGSAMSIILTDLTQQKEANEKIRKLNDELENKVTERTSELLLSREHFKFLAENIPAIAWATTPDGTVNFLNRRFYEYSGMSSENFYLDDWYQIVHEDDIPDTRENWLEALRTGQSFEMEYRFKNLSNEYRWHFGMANPIRNELGEIKGWFGIAVDIENQKREVKEKDEFISMVSHELKTPLTSLKGFTQLLTATLAETQAGMSNLFLEKMDTQINKLTRLISDLLDATRSNQGELQFNEEHFDFNELVREVVSEMQLTTTTHQLKLTPGKSMPVTGDRTRIGQVMTNMISNAIKYSPGNKDVLISTETTDRELIFSVRDFGIGIPESKHKQLYTRFYRVLGEKNAHTFPGMGLGLFISKTIIDRHRGKMWLNSIPGEGSVFYFSLPYDNMQ